MPPADPSLTTAAAFLCDFGVGVAIGTTLTTTTVVTPPVGQAFYYLVGHSNTTPGSKEPLGRRSDGSIDVAPVSCP